MNTTDRLSAHSESAPRRPSVKNSPLFTGETIAQQSRGVNPDLVRESFHTGESKSEVFISQENISQKSNLFFSPAARRLRKIFTGGILPIALYAVVSLATLVSLAGEILGRPAYAVGLTPAVKLEDSSEAARRFLGIKADSQIQEAYLLGADLALNEGGLALVEKVFKDSLVAIIARHPEELKKLEEYNQERLGKGNHPVLIVKSLKRAERVLTQKLRGKGVLHGFASPKEATLEWTRLLKENLHIMNEQGLERFAEAFGILPILEEFKARFQIAKSA